MSKSFDNVKVIIVDKNKKYLVGRRYDSEIKYSTLGGTREEGEDIFDVLYREFFEETSQVLHFDYKNKTLYLVDDKRKIPLKLVRKIQINKQIYFILSTEYDLSKYIDGWKNEFIQNQYELIVQTINKIRKKTNLIKDLEWIKFIFRYKDNFYNQSFISILRKRGLDKSKIVSILDKLTELSYYLEMDDLELVTKDELIAFDGLYEKDLSKIIQKLNK